ncbi:MAG: hypothetical protein J6Y62_00540 [Clostridia bacterium]|nr:hypothetical protein [Clostridia bacterium]
MGNITYIPCETVPQKDSNGDVWYCFWCVPTEEGLRFELTPMIHVPQWILHRAHYYVLPNERHGIRLPMVHVKDIGKGSLDKWKRFFREKWESGELEAELKERGET